MERIYHNPKKIKISKNKDLAPNERVNRNYFGEGENEIDSEKILHTFNESFDFTPLKTKGTQSTTSYDAETGKEGAAYQKEVVTGIANMEIAIDGTAFTSAHDYDAELAASQPIPNAAGLAKYEQLSNPAPETQNKYNQVQGNTTNVNTGATSNLSVSQKHESVYNKAIADGYTPAQAAGIVGSMTGETSGLDPGITNSIGASGICQWMGPRLENLKKFAAQRGTTYKDFDTQVDFMFHELNGSHKSAGNAIRSSSSAADAAMAHMMKFEVPYSARQLAGTQGQGKKSPYETGKEAQQNAQHRVSNANTLLAKLGNGNNSSNKNMASNNKNTGVNLKGLFGLKNS